MPRKSKYSKVWDQVVTNPESLLAMAQRFIQSLRNKNFTPMTIQANQGRLGMFLQWCDDRAITLVCEVTPPIMSAYHCYVSHRHHRQTHRPLSPSARFCYLNAVCRFFHWLAINNHILYNPTSGIELPKCPRSLTRDVLTQDEAEKIINQPDISTPQGIRDRAILETLYSSGIRVGELARLDISDVNLQRGIIVIRQGKGRKDRIVPLGARAAKWIAKYLSVRSQQPHGQMHETPLFLTVRNTRRLSKGGIVFWVNRYIKNAHVDKSGRCHLFRHTMATLMLENGAPIQCIKQMLGHSQLSTTEIYTRVNIDQLKQVHLRTHPADRGDFDDQ